MLLISGFIGLWLSMSQELLRVQVPIDVARLIHDIAMVEQTYIVGGFVRDLMLHIENDDIDIAVKNLDSVVQRLKSLGYSLSEEARSFRVIKVMLPGACHVDVAGFRTETYDLKSRKPVVQPAESIIEDSARRDFTINALSIIVKHVDTSSGAIVGVLIDPHGGLRDLREGVIRAVGNPTVRFLEDPLRMLRALRFAIKLGFRIEEDTWRAIRENVNELRRVSKERIMDELNKMLMASAPRAVQLLFESNLWSVVMPFLGPMASTFHDHRGHHHGESVLQHTIEALQNHLTLHGSNVSLASILAVLLHDVGKPSTLAVEGNKITFIGHAEKSAELATEWLRSMRYPNNIIRLVVPAVALHMRIHQSLSKSAFARLWVDAGEDYDVIMLAITIAESDINARYDQLRKWAVEFKNTPRLISGADVLDLPGPLRARALREVRLYQLSSGISEREKLLRFLEGIKKRLVATTTQS
ncbi:MAG: HDIG domain-containing protein [Vulcanisaeta sp.]|nr:HDIG domain-containing protein [Vulcanisaeta sp.]